MKLHRKIEHNEKVCWAQKLGYCAQGQGHSHVRCQIELKIRSEMTSYVLCKTLVPWLCSRSQPGIKAIIRDLRGHLLHTVTFLVPSCFERETIFVTYFCQLGGCILPDMGSTLKGKNLLQCEQILSIM